ncbi:MAG TPA: FkbM family methyltransferase [Xanthobacteraceae bacterium]|nr:FkbM family methyltransferase [Xanthobacteraceae bacterium]
MPVITIAIHQGSVQTLAMKLDLDPNRPNERSILAKLQSGASFEPDVANVFIKVLRTGDVVADIGANAGYLTVLAALLVGPSGHVVAFEPDAGNVERLRGNLVLNNCTNVTVVEKAVTNRVGEVAFFINSDDSGGSALWDVGQFPGNVKTQAAPIRLAVGATTLDAEWQSRGLAAPRLIKIDTEGAEQFVLEGARELLRDQQCRFVIAELHSFGLEKMGCNQATFRGLAASYGYSTFALLHSGALPRYFPAGTSIETTYAVNILLSRPEWVAEAWPAAAFDPRDPR